LNVSANAADLRVPPGNQLNPRWRVTPPRDDTLAVEAIELARMAGLDLDPWQRLVLEDMLATRGNAWASFSACLIVPRQNGKSAILEARMLAGLFLPDIQEELVVYTAHEARTAVEVMRRFEQLVMDTPMLRSRVKGRGFRWSHGQEGVELKSGQRCLFKTRTGGSGRGFSGDCVILDEAMKGLAENEIGALLPTLSSFANPQVIYSGSAGNEESTVLGRLVRRGRSGDPTLTYIDWCVDEDNYDPDDPASWAEANPNLGHRLNLAVILDERRSMGAETFARERLGVGTYPRDEDEDRLIPTALWNALRREGADADRGLVAPISLGIATKPDRSWSAIGVVWRDGDTDVLDVIEHRAGARWMVERVKELRAKWNPIAVVGDVGGPTGALKDDFDTADVEINWIGLTDYADATASLYDDMTRPASVTVAHRGHDGLTAAAAGVEERTVGDRWTWKRRGTTDITPLESVTLARHGLQKHLAALGAGGLWGFVA
jgi:hypothetical protein